MEKNNLIGQTFGSLLVLKEEGKTPVGHVTWKCECKCGKIVVRTGTSLIRSKYSNCGGSSDKYSNTCFSRPVGKDNANWKGHGEISSTWFSNVISRAADGRKSRSKIKKKLDITIEYIWELFLKQDRKCALSGERLFLPQNGTNFELKRSNASIDRIDSSLGYIEGNVQWVTKKVNIMKNIFTQEEFIRICTNVASNFKD